MPSQIRWVQTNRVYETSLRTVDRQFSLKPNQHPKNPLLAKSCPLNALNMNNDQTIPGVNEGQICEFKLMEL